MRVAILASAEDNHIPPLAHGLQRMMERIGVESKVFQAGLRWLALDNPFYFYPDAGRASRQLKTLAKKTLVYPYLAGLAGYDLIVLVINMPPAYMKHLRVELLRSLFPGKPVVLYDLHYLPTMGEWARALREGDPRRGLRQGGHYGLERYDWYLMVSATTEYPMARLRQPYSLVGMDLDDGTLYPDQKGEFVALVDFERPDHFGERAIQLQALKETGIKHVVLHGHYSIQEIRSIYRRCSLYFVAHREAFGLPICELQACGSLVFTPYARWCPAHQAKEDPYAPGPGSLSPNFVVYHNDRAELIQKIQAVKRAYDAQAVVDTFRHHQPHFWHGDPERLMHFVRMVDDREITSRSHRQYHDWPIVDRLKQDC